MKKLKLSTVTKAELQQAKIKPVDVESFAVQSINDAYPRVKLLGQYRSQGPIVRRYDPVTFQLYCRKEEGANLFNKTWIQVGGKFYEVEEVIEKLKEAGFEIENDL